MEKKSIASIIINQANGTFKSPGLELGKELVVSILRIDRGRAFYGAGYTPAERSKPTCRSVHGLVPINPPGHKNAHGFFDGGLSARCAACPQNNPKDKNRCRSVWSMMVVCADRSVRRLSLNVASQSALEQHIASLNVVIGQVQAAEGITLKICDFAMKLVLEKRPTMKVFGLAYPLPYGGSLCRIPFDNGVSKFQALFEQYDPESIKQAYGQAELDRLMGQCRSDIEEEATAETIPVILTPASIEADAMLDSLVEI